MAAPTGLSLDADEKGNRSPPEFLKETFHVRLRCGAGIGRIESAALSRDEVPHVPRSRSFRQRRDGDALRRSDGELASSGTNEEPLPILFGEPGGRERGSETGGERLNELKPSPQPSFLEGLPHGAKRRSKTRGNGLVGDRVVEVGERVARVEEEREGRDR